MRQSVGGLELEAVGRPISRAESACQAVPQFAGIEVHESAGLDARGEGWEPPGGAGSRVQLNEGSGALGALFIEDGGAWMNRQINVCTGNPA